jgi:hypothetical protein
MTIVFPIRMQPLELERARDLAAKSGAESLGEFIRLLLWREYNRRNGLPKPKPSDYQSAFRKGGRPSWYQLQQRKALGQVQTSNTDKSRHKPVIQRSRYHVAEQFSLLSRSSTRAASGSKSVARKNQRKSNA